MATSVIVLALDDDVDIELGKAAADGGSRYVPVGGPPGEYPDADPGAVRAVWIVSPPTPDVLAAITAAGERAEPWRGDSALQWEEPDADPPLPRTPTRLPFVNPPANRDKPGFADKWANRPPGAGAH